MVELQCLVGIEILTKICILFTRIHWYRTIKNNDDNQYSQGSSHQPEGRDSAKGSASIHTNKQKKKNCDDVDKHFEESKKLWTAIEACNAHIS